MPGQASALNGAWDSTHWGVGEEKRSQLLRQLGLGVGERCLRLHSQDKEPLEAITGCLHLLDSKFAWLRARTWGGRPGL